MDLIFSYLTSGKYFVWGVFSPRIFISFRKYVRKKMQSTPQRAVGGLWIYLLFIITFWTVLGNRIIFFLSEKHLLIKFIKEINSNKH